MPVVRHCRTDAVIEEVILWADIQGSEEAVFGFVVVLESY